MTTLMALIAVPFAHTAIPLVATPSSNTTPVSLSTVPESTVPESLRITPAPPPPEASEPHIFLFFAKPDPAPKAQPEAVPTPAAQVASSSSGTPAPAPAAAPAITFAVPQPPPHVDPPPAPPAPPAPRYHLSSLARHMVASCLVLEAASQGEYGMRGVMAVIRNRAHANPQRFLPTILQQKQFSALNDLTAGNESMSSVVARAEQDRMWSAALRIVDEATSSTWHDPTGGATHYTRVGEHTGWTNMLARTVTIGRHAFYR